jgi:hypothetical protein
MIRAAGKKVNGEREETKMEFGTGGEFRNGRVLELREFGREEWLSGI